MFSSTSLPEVLKNSISENAIDIVVNPSVESQYWNKILKCIETEGWTSVLSDYEIWLKSVHDFCYYFVIDKTTDEPIASLCSGKYCSLDGNPKNAIYAVGMYYVIPELRGKGLGNYLFSKMMDQIDDHNVVLNGVLKMAPEYAKRYGFNKCLSEPHDYFLVPTKRLQVPSRDLSVITKDLNEVSFDDIVAYDQTEILPGFDRKKYLKDFLNSPEAMTKVAFQDRKLVGLLCLRETNGKLTAGPFYASRMEVAKTLVHDVLKEKKDWRQFSAFGSVAPRSCLMARELFEGMDIGEDSATPFVYLQFTKKIEPAAYEKAFGIMECAMSFI